jgi:hypothetical protein
VFFPAYQGGKIFPPGAQENAENFRHEERNQESTFALQMNLLLQNEFTHEKYNYRQLRLAADEI